MSKNPHDEDIVTIREYSVPMEADWAQNVLAAAGICCLIPDRNANSLVPFPSPSAYRYRRQRLQMPRRFSAPWRCTGSPLAGLKLEKTTRARIHGRAEGEVQETENVEAIDPHDLCPVPGRAPQCPLAARKRWRPPPPPRASESLFGSLVSAATGRGWLRCASCGHAWEG